MGGKRRRLQNPVRGCSKEGRNTSKEGKTRVKKKQRHDEKGSDDDHDGGSPSVLAGHDILRLILLRLPLHKLHQCKTVCKSWKSVISDPAFRCQYLDGNPGNNRFCKAAEAKVYWDESPHSCSGHCGKCKVQYNLRKKKWECVCAILSFKSVGGQRGVPEKYHVLDAICRRSRKDCFPDYITLEESACGVVLFYDYFQLRFLVYSPLTGAMNTLPIGPKHLWQYKAVFICQEPQGCDSKYEFKVVLIPRPAPFEWSDRNDIMKIHMYSSKTRLWTRSPVANKLLSHIHTTGHDIVVVKEKLYWSKPQQVVSYDLITRQVEIFQVPPFLCPDQHKGCPVLGQDASGGVLCFVFCQGGFDVLRFYRVDGGATADMWTKICHVGYAKMIGWINSPEVVTANDVWLLVRLSIVRFIGPNLLMMSSLDGWAYNLESGQLEEAPEDAVSYSFKDFHIPSWPFGL